MLKLNNLGARTFSKYIERKDLYIFGAGELLDNCIDIYCNEKRVCAVVDNNSKLWGTFRKIKNQNIPVMCVDDFAKKVKSNIENTALLVTPTFYAEEIIHQLDEISELDGLECFVHLLIRNTPDEITPFVFSNPPRKIPKKIHYFWIGGNPLPKQFETYINTWSKFNPDYEIIRWDESNYDFSKIAYMKEAYDNKQWAFATDYARLDIIYKHGGIYFDTDVEALRNLDCLLNDEAFFGFGSGDRIADGVGFGAIAGSEIIKEMMDYYSDKHFVNADGSCNRAACYYYQHPIFKRHGFKINNEYQLIDKIAVYPSDVMSPKGTGGFSNNFSERTLSIHHGSNLWETSSEKEKVNRMLCLAKERIKAFQIEFE